MEDNFLLKNCLKKVTSLQSNPDFDNWTHSDFVRLSEDIIKKTTIYLSHKTLKRLLGKEKYTFSYSPQLETKNALAKYIGYNDWQDYVTKETEKNTSEELIKQQNLIKKTSISKKRIVIISIIILLIIAIYFILTKNVNSYKYTFKISQNSGITPFSSIIEYDFSQIKSDSIFIDFTDSKPPIHIKNKKGSFLHSFIIPHLYKVKLIIDNKNISTLDVFGKSNGWEAQAVDNFELYPVKTNIEKDSNGILTISKSEVDAIGSVLNRKIFWTKFMNYDDFTFQGDSLIIETKVIGEVQSSDLKCNDIAFRLFCENEMIQLHFMPQGCLDMMRSRISEIEFNGKEKEYLEFGRNLNNWFILKLIIQSKKASIYFNNELIKEVKYKKKLGLVKGISYKFRGIGAIDYIHIFSPTYKNLYINEFDNY